MQPDVVTARRSRGRVERGPVTRSPMVSVIIPAYKCENYISDAVRGVLQQSYDNLEVIVVDGSPDESTRRALARYRQQIRYLYQEPRGVAAARNLGISCAQGDLIAFQDADDLWLPDKLELQVRAFEQYSDVALVFTETVTFDDAGGVGKVLSGDKLVEWLRAHRTPDTDVGYGSIYESLLAANCVHTSSVVVRKAVLDEVGGFDETFTFCDDYDLWLRVVRKHRVVYIDRVLCKYRVRADGLSGDAEQRYIRWGHDGIRVWEKHLRKNWIPASIEDPFRKRLVQTSWNMGLKLFELNRFSDARVLFTRCVRSSPLHSQPWLYLCACFLPFSLIDAIRRLKRSRRSYLGSP